MFIFAPLTAYLHQNACKNESHSTALVQIRRNENNSRHVHRRTRPLVVHRLDMHTSGLLVVAKTIDVYRALQKAFAERKVEKRYVAVLDGEVEKDEGEIRLPLRLDLDRRPMQVVDYAHGKEAVTRYRVLARSSGATRVEFAPLTGRTHQLRVHAAHQSGLNAPIKGDMLYGNFSDRLYLHASFLKFNHPVDNKEIILESIPNF